MDDVVAFEDDVIRLDDSEQNVELDLTQLCSIPQVSFDSSSYPS